MRVKGILILGTFLPPALSFFSHWLLVQYIGVVEYGHFGYQVQVFSVVCLLGDFGLTTIFMGYGKKASGLLSSFLISKLVAFSPFYVVLWLFSSDVVAAIFALGLAFQLFIAASCRIYERYKLYFFVRVFPWLFFLAIIQSCQGESAQFYLKSFLFSNLIVVLLAFLIGPVKRYIVKRVSISKIHLLYRKSWPIFLSSIFIAVSNSYLIELFLLKKVDEKGLGTFSLFVQFSMLNVLVQSYLTTYYLPLISGMKNKEVWKVMKKQTVFFAVSFLFLGGGGTFFVPILYHQAENLASVTLAYFIFFSLEVVFHPCKVIAYLHRGWFLAVTYGASILIMVLFFAIFWVVGIEISINSIVVTSLTARVFSLLFLAILTRDLDERSNGKAFNSI